MIRKDFHVHSTFSDGKHDPEEIVLEAIRLGMTDLGFSDHSWTSFDESWCMARDRIPEYCSTIRALQKKYEDRIRIHLGIEQDYYADLSAGDYDYVIGSVHYVRKDGVYLEVDESAEIFEKNVREHYGGDYVAFAADYYELVGNLARKTGADIIGHFDLITKFNEGDRLFSTAEARYIQAARRAADRLLAHGKIFEINTGAMCRGCRTAPYPSASLQEYIRSRGGTFILSSDSHDKGTLMYGFRELE